MRAVLEVSFLQALNRTVRAYTVGGSTSLDFIAARRELVRIGKELEAGDRHVLACGDDRGPRC